MWPIVTDVASSVCVLDTLVSSAKIAELMEMLFGVWTLAHPINHVLAGGLYPYRKGHFGRTYLGMPVPTVDIPSVIHKGTAPHGNASCGCHYRYCSNFVSFSFQCFDAVGWVTGIASGPCK